MKLSQPLLQMKSNLEKFLAGIYKDYHGMFREETFNLMIRDLSHYVVDYLTKCWPVCKADVDVFFYDVLNFPVYRSDIPLGTSVFWNAIYDVYEYENCTPPIIEFCKACQLDGFDLNYDKLED